MPLNRGNEVPPTMIGGLSGTGGLIAAWRAVRCLAQRGAVMHGSRQGNPGHRHGGHDSVGTSAYDRDQGQGVRSHG
jgi:hypothetical protein